MTVTLKRAMFVAPLALACANRSYLGAPTPAACASGDAERCAGWLAERDLDAGELDVYDDPLLRAYVQTVADRLARGSHLARPPRVVISNHDGTYAPFGERIVIGRVTIEKLGSEAELAGIVAHELVHVEGHHATVSLFGPETDEAWLAARRDAEAIADERAVALLERAGYTPAAMPRALAAALPTEAMDDNDDEHPPRDERIARVAALAADRNGGFEGRRELLQHVDHMVAGRDTRLGLAVGRAWVVANLGIALELPRSDVARSDGDSLVLRHGRATLDAYPIGAPWAKELAATLEQSASAPTALGTVTVGTAPDRGRASEPLAKLERAVRASLPQPAPGAWVVIVERCEPHACGGLVIEIASHGDLDARDHWLGGLRAASARELAATTPVHITVAIAPRAASIKELVARCPDPSAALRLDNADRVLAQGEPFKCTDR